MSAAIASLVSLPAPRGATKASCSARNPRAPVSLSSSRSLSNAVVLKTRVVAARGVGHSRVAVTPVTANLSTGRVKISVQGKAMEVTDAISAYAQEKIGHALEPFEQALRVREVDVMFSVRGGEKTKGEKLQTVECTIYTKKHVFRAEDSEESLYASIDKVADRIARKLRKTKERTSPKGSKTAREMDVSELDAEEPLEAPGASQAPGASAKASLPEEVIRTKYFTTPPMTVKEAIANLEMVDHDFYVFIESKSNAVNVVYKRRAGDYGLIVPMPEEK